MNAKKKKKLCFVFVKMLPGGIATNGTGGT
jgi:hypothetical protein